MVSLPASDELAQIRVVFAQCTHLISKRDHALVERCRQFAERRHFFAKLGRFTLQQPLRLVHCFQIGTQVQRFSAAGIDFGREQVGLGAQLR